MTRSEGRSGNYTFLETEVTNDGEVGDQNTVTTGEPLLRRPRNSGSISVGYQRDRFQVSSTLFVKGQSKDRDFRVYVADGNAYFNRPGPRIVESLETLAACLEPDVFPDLRDKHHASVVRLDASLKTHPF